MSHPLPAGAARLVSRRPLGDDTLPSADYPSNARCFVHLDARLLPYWHTLFDICPGLLKLDPPEGLNLFRSFMVWSYRHRPSPNWTYYLSVCRWLLGSTYRLEVDEEPIEAFMIAAAARWVASDETPARGLVLAWQGSPLRVVDGKSAHIPAVPLDTLAPPPWDFAWCPLDESSAFTGWLPVP